MLCEVVGFAATAEAHKILVTIRDVAHPLDLRETVKAPKGKVDLSVVPKGWWQKLVFHGGRPEESVDRNGSVFGVLEQFHTVLKHRDIFVAASDRWSDHRARLLSRPAWESAKGPELGVAAAGAARLSARRACRDLGRGMANGVRSMTAGGDITVDTDGRMHLGKDDALEESPGLKYLRTRVADMVPRVDLPNWGST